jgi:phosphoribosylformylglycinamidine cyclo-ligase
LAGKEPGELSAYAGSGVDIDAGTRAVNLMRAAVQSTYTPEVLAGLGAFGGLYDASGLAALSSPVLVASTDGVGTKVRLAAQAGRYRGIGHDIVNHCINDILVQGARPLFFLDYIASSRLEPERMAEIVSGIAEACRAAGCALLGGETAEMPGVYAPDEFDVAGTIVGVVERKACLPRADVAAGDLLLGLSSNGPHTNGYSLIRRAIAGMPLDEIHPALGESLADAVLRPHRSYLPLVAPLLSGQGRPIKALAHLTGGGFIENLPRVLPDGLSAIIERSAWPVPPLFGLIQQNGDVAPEEMYRVFNMGIGMVAVVAPGDAREVQSGLAEESWVIGHLEPGAREVRLA